MAVSMCPQCGAQGRPGAAFCPACGARYPAAPVCARCGAPLEPGAAFCERCGTPVSAPAVAAAAPLQPPAPSHASAYDLRPPPSPPGAPPGYPPAAASAPMAASDRTAITYAPPSGRARAAIILLALTILVNLAAIGSDANEISLLGRLDRGEFVSQDEIDASDNRQAVFGALQFLVLIGAAIPFLMWVHRVARNARALGARDLRFSPGWAVGWYLVPIMQLFRPYQAMKEIWLASDPNVPVSTAEQRARKPTPRLIG